MKIAIAAEGQDINAQVSQRGARAPYYLVFDANGKMVEVLSNPYSNVDRGAGPKAAHLLVQQGITLAVAADFGGRFVGELEDNGVQLIQKAGIVSGVINDVLTK
ncbi:MAG: NifB/NifX family molybdenum-iron cluster-binding protein [Gammaproteobacteria bacterium]|jgi:predicted Fe-Mo cluster-binding NifX family protein